MYDTPVLGAGTWTWSCQRQQQKARGEGLGRGLAKAELAEVEKPRCRDAAPGWRWPRVNGASRSAWRDERAGRG